MTTEELRALRLSKIEKMDALLAKGENMSEDETKSFDALDKSQEDLQAQIQRSEKLSSLNEELSKPTSKAFKDVNITKNLADDEVLEKTGFKNFGEYLQAVQSGNDSRLNFTADQSLGVPKEGGFLVPPEFGKLLIDYDPDQSLVRPRATVLPASAHSEAELRFPSLDQSGADNMYAGVSVTWLDENKDIPPSNWKLKEISLRAKGIKGLIPLSNELLRNTATSSKLASTLLRQALSFAEDGAFINGDGVGKPTGFLKSACLIKSTRTQANKISVNDLLQMISSFRGKSPQWIISKTAFIQIANLKDSIGNLLWQTNVVNGFKGTIFGYPVTFSDYTPTLGTVADVILADFSKYYIKDGQGIVLSMSSHENFSSDKTLIKATKFVDGKVATTDKMEINGVKYSPFVALDGSGAKTTPSA